jgi:hypothetical protein
LRVALYFSANPGNIRVSVRKLFGNSGKGKRKKQNKKKRQVEVKNCKRCKSMKKSKNVRE